MAHHPQCTGRQNTPPGPGCTEQSGSRLWLAELNRPVSGPRRNETLHPNYFFTDFPHFLEILCMHIIFLLHQSYQSPWYGVRFASEIRSTGLFSARFGLRLDSRYSLFCANLRFSLSQRFLRHFRLAGFLNIPACLLLILM